MAPRDFYATMEGYRNKQNKKAALLRLAVWASLSTWEGSISFEVWSSRFFPLAFDNENTEPVEEELTEDEVKNIVAIHKKAHLAENGRH